MAWARAEEAKDYLASLVKYRDDHEDTMVVAIDENEMHKASIFRGRSQGIEDAIMILKDMAKGGQDDDEDGEETGDDNTDSTWG